MLAPVAITALLIGCGGGPPSESTKPPDLLGTGLRVVAMSVVPDPATAAYTQCLVHFIAEDEQGDQINAIAWAFRDRQLTVAGTLSHGDLLRVDRRPYSEVEKTFEREMAAADAADLDLPATWIDTIYQINGNTPSQSSSTGNQSDTVTKIHRILAAHGSGGIGHSGSHDWFFLLNYPDLHSPDFLVPSAADLAELSSPVPVILDFKNELAKHGIGLVFVVAPLKVHMFPGYATNLPYEPETHGRIDLATQRMVADLKNQGVLAIDCVSLLNDSRWEEYEPGHFTPIYSPYHHHWSSYGAKLVAEDIVTMARDAGFAPETSPQSPIAYTRETAPPPEKHVGDGPWPGRDRELFSESFWIAPETTENPEGAEVLLLGDSFCYLWEERNASFHHHLSAGFGQTVEKIIVNGSSATFTRQQMARNWGNYENLKLVVWEVSEAYLADKQLWQPVKLDSWIDLSQHLADATPSGGKVETVTDRDTLRLRSAGLAFEASAKPVRLKWTGVKLGDSPKLITALCHPLVEGAPASDGVTFAVHVDGERVGFRSIRPPTKKKPSSFAKQWAVPLNDFAGLTVDLELVVEPRDHADGDRGIWVEPTLLDATLSQAE